MRTSIFRHVMMTALGLSLLVTTSGTPPTAAERTVVKAQIARTSIDDFVLTCPPYEVLDSQHPCSETMQQALHRDLPDQYVLVCPIKEVLDSRHPCAETNSLNPFRGNIDDFVLVCPLQPLAGTPDDPQHPCNTTASTVELVLPATRLSKGSTTLLFGVLPILR